MEHLNFCRQMVKQFTSEAGIPSVAAEMKAYKSHCIDLAKASQKFMLPDGGRLYDDPEFKALDESEMLSLPFPLVALEFTRSKEYVAAQIGEIREHVAQPAKSLLFARERDDAIAITVVAWAEHVGLWVPFPEVAIPRVGYLDRSMRSSTGRVAIKVAFNKNSAFQPSAQDYMDEIGALLCMLNILSCKNVHIEKSHPGKVRAAMAAGKKGALPFDSYHVLMIDPPAQTEPGAATGGHRTPREHLRRGHIRRLADGRRIWVNATVVSAGRGGGVVTKDYAFRPAGRT